MFCPLDQETILSFQDAYSSRPRSTGLLALSSLMARLVLLLFAYGPDQGSGSPIQEIAYTTDMTNEQQFPDLSRIVESLENLGVLDRRPPTRCYSLDKIVKFQRRDDKGRASLRIEFHINQFQRDAPGLPSGYEYRVENVLHHLNNDSSGKFGTSSGSLSAVLGCFDKLRKLDIASVPEATNSAQTPDDSVLAGQDAVESVNNDTTVTATNTSSGTGTARKKEEGGLSLAQIMVISSCSIVIGLFFLVALTMRLRHYIQRKREVQQSRRPPYRSSNAASKGTNVITVTTGGVKIKQHKEKAPPKPDKTYPSDRLQWYGRELLFSM